jgi:hypothetical protein
MASAPAAVRKRMLTFVVAGGGFAGVGTIGAINDLVHDPLRYYPQLAPQEARVVLVHPGEVVLPELGEKRLLLFFEFLNSDLLQQLSDDDTHLMIVFQCDMLQTFLLCAHPRPKFRVSKRANSHRSRLCIFLF